MQAGLDAHQLGLFLKTSDITETAIPLIDPDFLRYDDRVLSVTGYDRQVGSRNTH
jgi:hypothetical protein